MHLVFITANRFALFITTTHPMKMMVTDVHILIINLPLFHLAVTVVDNGLIIDELTYRIQKSTIRLCMMNQRFVNEWNSLNPHTPLHREIYLVMHAS